MLISLCALASAVFLALCVAFADPWWGYAAVAVSLAGVAVFVVDKLIRRRAAAPIEDDLAEDEPEADAQTEAQTEAETAETDVEDEEPAEPVAPIAAVSLETDEVVATIPGRRRFHLLSCELLPADGFEEITESEARAEGFTACSSCLPINAVRTGSGAA